MHLDSLRRALADSIGQTLTPELCASIENRARIAPDHSIDLSLFEPLRLADGYVVACERFADIVDELHVLHEAHWLQTEMHRHGLALKPDYQAMVADERAGRLLQFTVRFRGELIGNLRLYVLPNRHTGGTIAQEDTLYIAAEHRTGLLGLKLLRYAENCLTILGVESIEANSKIINHADVLLRRMKYAPVAIQFFKILKEKNAQPQ